MRVRVGRSRWRRVLALGACGVMAAAMPAPGQRLNFDAAGVFQTGTEKSVAALRDALRDEVKKNSESSIAGTPVAAAQSRVRELAAGLLEAGSSFGEAGSVHVLIGRRLAARRDEADEAIRRIGGNDAGVAVLTAFLEECPVDGVLLPRAAPDLDRLLAGIFEPLAAQLGGRAPGAAWPIDRLDEELSSEGAFAAAIEEAAKSGGVSGEAVLALEARIGEVSGAEAKAERQLVVQACAAAAAPVRWLDKEARAALAAMFGSAAKGMGAEGSRVGAKTDLVRLALVADVLRRIERGKFTARQARTMRTAGAALARELKPGTSDSDDAINALRRGLVLLDQYEHIRWSDTRRLVREVRPVWRETEIHARGAREELIEALARITPTSPALSDPAVLAGLSAVARVVADARGICVASAWLAGADDAASGGERVFNSTPPEKPGDRRAEPVTDKDDRVRRQAGARLLSLAPRMRPARTQDETVASVRELASGLDAWFRADGASRIGATPEIAAAIDAAKQRWTAAWAGLDQVAGAEGPAPEADAGVQLELLNELVRIGADTRLLTGMAAADGGARAAAWPGFQLSAGAMGMAMSPLTSDLSGASGLVGAGDYVALEKKLITMRGHAKIVATLTAIEQGAAAHGLMRRGVFEELASPPSAWPTLDEDLTPAVWLGASREAVALLCRGLEEYADATKAGERERGQALLRFIVAECDRVQRGLGIR